MRQRIAAAFGWMLIASSLTGCYARPFGGGYQQNPCCCPQPTCCSYGTTAGSTAYYSEPAASNSSVAASSKDKPTPATARSSRSRDDVATTR